MPPENPHHLAHYHPLVLEGMGAYDSRPPETVARQITHRLRAHWRTHPPRKPLLLLTQGDPPAPRGIAAITPLVAVQLAIPRAVVCLDAELAPYHPRDADRQGVQQEYQYQALRAILAQHQPQKLAQLEAAIDAEITNKNKQRGTEGKSPLPAYYPLFARLQEVVKGASRQLSGGLTVAHTSTAIHPYSVTSFYQQGLASGLWAPEELVTYPAKP
ncbi:MAG: hypothetical protein RI842_08365 [Schleiferiaceae bacterium]|nr:hypothetical protein [Schleiferiaceae bacterium]MDR9442721.1 hypothetical protein [Schleiferiaceae bacterium]